MLDQVWNYTKLELDTYSNGPPKSNVLYDILDLNQICNANTKMTRVGHLERRDNYVWYTVTIWIMNFVNFMNFGDFLLISMNRFSW